MIEEKGGRINISSGFIYILSNPAFPEYFKIGRTERSVNERAKELSSNSGVPFEYKVEYSIATIDSIEAESKVHSLLEKHRENKNREFFSIDLTKAISTIEDVVSEQYRFLINGLSESVQDKIFEKIRSCKKKEIHDKHLKSSITKGYLFYCPICNASFKKNTMICKKCGETAYPA